MNEISIFQFESSNIRTTLIENEPWWVAKDVCEALGYVWKGVSGTISHVSEEWVGVCSVQTPSGSQEMAIISEQGLYFFLGRSDKQTALPFQKWIAGKVIPSIRKHGVYSINKEELLTKQEALRLVEKSAFKSMTESIDTYKENERMHGFAYSSYNNLIYRMILGKDSKQLKSEYGIKKGETVKDFLDPDKLKQVENAERLVDAMLRIGKQFNEIKAELEKLLIIKIA